MVNSPKTPVHRSSEKQHAGANQRDAEQLNRPSDAADQEPEQQENHGGEGETEPGNHEGVGEGETESQRDRQQGGGR